MTSIEQQIVSKVGSVRTIIEDYRSQVRLVSSGELKRRKLDDIKRCEIEIIKNEVVADMEAKKIADRIQKLRDRIQKDKEEISAIDDGTTAAELNIKIKDEIAAVREMMMTKVDMLREEFEQMISSLTTV